MWSMLLSMAGGGIKDWLSHKSDLEKRKAVARIRNVSKGIPGYSDEFLVLVWSYPFVASFVPGLRGNAAQGLEFFNGMPEWYIGGFMSISFAVFGIDKIFRWKGK